MGSIVFSQSPARAPHSLNWLSPIRAAFAFFAPPQTCNHRYSNLSAKPLPNSNSFFAAEASAVSKIGCPIASIVLSPAPKHKQIMSAKRVCQVGSLKVLREFEPGKSRSSTGRLVISGRMADVCAVLERMSTEGAARP